MLVSLVTKAEKERLVTPDLWVLEDLWAKQYVLTLLDVSPHHPSSPSSFDEVNP